MSTAILGATSCAAVVVAVAWAWNRLGGLLGADRHPRQRLAHDLAGRTLTPPAMWVGAGLVLTEVGLPHPWLVPLFGAVTLQGLHALLRRCFALLVEFTRARAELVGLLAFWLVVLAWAWALQPAREWSEPLLASAALLGIVAIEQVWARRLELAVRRREIRSTGLRPLLVDHPGWELDQVDVLPDRDSVCVRYVRRPGVGSLWVDLYAAGPPDPPGGTQAWTLVGPALWRLDETDSPGGSPHDTGFRHDTGSPYDTGVPGDPCGSGALGVPGVPGIRLGPAGRVEAERPSGAESAGEAGPAGGLGGADAALGGTGTVRYVALVDDQVVRLEFDGGRAHDPAACAVVSCLRPVSPRELAERELGTPPPRRRPRH